MTTSSPAPKLRHPTPLPAERQLGLTTRYLALLLAELEDSGVQQSPEWAQARVDLRDRQPHSAAHQRGLKLRKGDDLDAAMVTAAKISADAVRDMAASHAGCVLLTEDVQVHATEHPDGSVSVNYGFRCAVWGTKVLVPVYARTEVAKVADRNERIIEKHLPDGSVWDVEQRRDPVHKTWHEVSRTCTKPAPKAEGDEAEAPPA